MRITVIIVFFFVSAQWNTASSVSCFPTASFCSRISPVSKCTQTVRIPSRTRLCPRDTRRGDREFKGHGPDVTAKAWLSLHSTNRIALNLSLYAVETRKDFTEARGNWQFPVCNVPSGYKINRIITSAKSDTSYRDSNHKLDFPAIKNGTLVRKFEINGDTRGNDIGNCTTGDVYMNVHFNSARLEIQRLEKIISRMDAQNDYPVRLVNKLSKGVRSVSHDNSFWYISQLESIWKIPVSVDYKSISKLDPASIQTIELPPFLKRKGYSRFGDSDQHNGRLYISLEGDGPVKNRPLLAIFKTSNMKLIGMVPMKQWQTTISALAINPVSGLLYITDTGLSRSARRYRVNLIGEKFSLTPVSTYSLLDRIGRNISFGLIKSGSFSADGRYLFLLSASGNTGQLISFNHRTRKEMLRRTLPAGSIHQAVSYWNTGIRAPGIRGHLHLITLHPNANDRDAFSIKHYSVREIFDINTS